jgi:hypothetical protein
MRVQPRTRYLEGALKIVALHPALCVGYAGDVSVAQDAIRQLRIERDSTFGLGEVTSYLAKRIRYDGTEFIVASLVPTPTLVRVSGGYVSAGGDRY